MSSIGTKCQMQVKEPINCIFMACKIGGKLGRSDHCILVENSFSTLLLCICEVNSGSVTVWKLVHDWFVHFCW